MRWWHVSLVSGYTANAVLVLEMGSQRSKFGHQKEMGLAWPISPFRNLDLFNIIIFQWEEGPKKEKFARMFTYQGFEKCNPKFKKESLNNFASLVAWHSSVIGLPNVHSNVFGVHRANSSNSQRKANNLTYIYKLPSWFYVKQMKFNY